jgi:acyl carrier protein
LLLDELTRDLDLSVFALFSSAAGAVGNPGQGSYASADAVLDALAQQRHADGLAATSIAWAASAGGVAQADGAQAGGVQERSQWMGAVAIEPELAISIMRRVVVGAEPTVVVADLKAPQVLQALLSLRPSPLLSDLPEARRIAEAADAAGSQIRDQLLALPEAKRVGFLVDLVRTQAGGVLRHSGTEVMGADKAFRELGVDSLTAIEIRSQLVSATGLTLPTTLVFDYPTPRVLAGHLLGELLGDTEEVTEKQIRAVLDSLSLARLRDAGVLDAFLQLTRQSAAGTSTSREESTEPTESADSIDSIDTIDADDLVEAALKGQSALSPKKQS